MTTVAIIAEYNPFHKGHQHQIEKIREEFGPETAVIIIMSGNYTQRGEIAVIGKDSRAKCAVLGGANLVLELPFPFSSSSAEFFARSGVKIADSLGIVDYLSFGSESGDINVLVEAAKITSSDEYKAAFSKINDKAMGYPERCERAYAAISQNQSFKFTPNNILALEYIKAIFDFKSPIKPHTVKRLGAGYSEPSIQNGTFQSAMAIRTDMQTADLNWLDFVPESSHDVYKSIKENGEFPTDISKISAAFISYFRLNPPSVSGDIIHDAEGGLYNRLYNESFEANDINSLLARTETKKYTRARIRRAMLNAYFGVTSSEVRALPHYTQVLAMDNIGMRILKSVRKRNDFEILTKPSAYDHFDGVKRFQKIRSDEADAIFELSKPIPKSGKSALKFTPYIKK